MVSGWRISLPFFAFCIMYINTKHRPVKSARSVNFERKHLFRQQQRNFLLLFLGRFLDSLLNSLRCYSPSDTECFNDWVYYLAESGVIDDFKQPAILCEKA